MSSTPTRRSGGRRAVRIPAGVGCLVAFIALPLALFAAFVATLRALLHTTSSAGRVAARGGARGASAVHASAAEIDLCEFVRKMSLDDSFDAEDARSAGLPVGRGATVESLLDGGLVRGWIERRGDPERYAVTSRGREESEAALRRQGL